MTLPPRGMERVSPMLALALAACVRLLSPVLFAETPSGLLSVAVFLSLVLLYSLLWGWWAARSPRESLPGAVLLALALGALAVVSAPGEEIPPRWIPSNLREIPGVAGVLALLLSLTGWSFRILSGFWTGRAGAARSRDEGRWGFYLPVPFSLATSAVEAAIRGNPAPLLVVSGFSVILGGILGLSARERLARPAARVKAAAQRWTTLFWRDDRAFAVLIGLFAFALRAAFAAGLNRAALDPRFLDGPDSGVYDHTAWLLASGQKNILDPGLWLYSYNAGPSLLYALLYKVIGHRPEWVRFLQAGAAAGTIVLLFRMGVSWFGPTAARIGAFLAAGRGYLVGYGTYLGSETPGLLFLTLVLLLLRRIQVRSKESQFKGSAWRAGGAGALMGILILTRPEYRWFVLAGIAWLGTVLRGRSPRAVAAWTLGALLLLTPMMARNYVSVGRFELNDPQVIQAQYGLRSLQKHVKRVPQGPADFGFLAEVSRFAARHPLRALRAVGGDLAYNFYTFWNWKRYVFNPAFVFFVRNERVIFLIGAFLTLMFLLGLWASRGNAASLSLLYWLIGYKTLIHLFTENNEWWRFTVEPFVNLFQGCGVCVLAKYVARALPPRLAHPGGEPPQDPVRPPG